MKDQSPSVLIVGAGPVGLSTALALTQAGVAVRLIDKLPVPTNQSRAAIVHARTMEMFERLDIVESFLQTGTKIRGAEIYGPHQALLTHPTLDHLPTAFPYMLGLEQFETERILREHLTAQGVVVERPVELTGLSASDDAVGVELTGPGGVIESTAFSYVIGTDGARSSVRHALGLTLEGETIDTTWITADVKMSWDRPFDRVITYLTPEGFAFLGPMNDQRWRIILNLHKMDPKDAEKVTLQDVETVLRTRFDIDVTLSDCVWLSPFSINTRMTSTMRQGRVFLSGDSSHVHSPIGGQGMNTGIQDGLNLAWKLALVLQGKATDALLETFNTERHGNAKRLLEAVGPATRMANLHQPVPVEIRNFAIRVASQLGLTSRMPRAFSMLEIGYPNSPLNAEHHAHKHLIRDAIADWLPFDHAPRPGQRAPDVSELVQGVAAPRRLFEFWKGDARHQLLIFAGANQTDAQLSELIALAREFTSDFINSFVIVGSPMPAIPEVLTDINGEAHSSYGATHPTLYLIRPDGYIAFRADSAERTGLVAYLDEWYPGRAA